MGMESQLYLKTKYYSFYYMVAFGKVYLYKAESDSVRFDGYTEIPEFVYNICTSSEDHFNDFSFKVVDAG